MPGRRHTGDSRTASSNYGQASTVVNSGVSSEVGMQTTAIFWSKAPTFWATFTGLWSNARRFWANCWRTLGECAAFLGKSCRTLIKCVAFLGKLLAHFGRMRGVFGQMLPHFGRMRGDFEQLATAFWINSPGYSANPPLDEIGGRAVFFAFCPKMPIYLLRLDARASYIINPCNCTRLELKQKQYCAFWLFLSSPIEL